MSKAVTKKKAPIKAKKPAKKVAPKKPAKKGLKDVSAKEERFCVEYVCDAAMNATQAYLKAFPHVKYGTARVSSCKLLAKANIKARISELKRIRAKRLGITVDRVLSEFAKQAFYDPREFFNDDMSLKKISELHPDLAAVIQGIETSSSGDILPTTTTKIKLPDKRPSLEALSKYLKMAGDSIPAKGVSPFVKQVLDGKLSARDACYHITMLGLPLPEVLKIQMRAEEAGEGEESESITPEELERKYQEAIAAADQQRLEFLPERTAQVAELKEMIEKDGVFQVEGGQE